MSLKSNILNHRIDRDKKDIDKTNRAYKVKDDHEINQYIQSVLMKLVENIFIFTEISNKSTYKSTVNTKPRNWCNIRIGGNNIKFYLSNASTSCSRLYPSVSFLYFYLYKFERDLSIAKNIHA